MSIAKKLIIFSVILFVSCGETPKKDTVKPPETEGIEGFWKRTGMVQYVNGVAVDTMFYADGDLDPPGKDFIQMKAFLNGNIFWIMNNKNPDSPWKGSMGGYGKYKKETDSITEFMSHATGDMAVYLKNMKDEQNSSTIPFKFGYTLTDQNYIQKQRTNEDGISTGEFYEKMPGLGKSKLDGIWKRSYEISYINGVAVDTTSVPSDVILDIKIIKDGYFLFHVDRTKLAGDDPSKPQFGGTGGYGEVEYINGDMLEYAQFGSGTWLLDTLPRSFVSYVDIKFYDEDTFIQVTKDTLNQSLAGRGLIYKRIE
ncbi:hypothetical protein N9848_03460 [Flavobacteriaceae bacterium]|nr:hypothetical protein [Flavobacteriaceae bacterium]MDB4255675.1 hypothetical protein [Flavobacteriaceae bacterium]|tara:strand:- start:2077 stop:3009 length:933 start_codon:yes stop_codon:yes gene_type:complete